MYYTSWYSANYCHCTARKHHAAHLKAFHLSAYDYWKWLIPHMLPTIIIIIIIIMNISPRKLIEEPQMRLCRSHLSNKNVLSNFRNESKVKDLSFILAGTSFQIVGPQTLNDLGPNTGACVNLVLLTHLVGDAEERGEARMWRSARIWKKQTLPVSDTCLSKDIVESR